jgi:cyclase
MRKRVEMFSGGRVVGVGLVLAVLIAAVCAPGAKRATARAESAKRADEAQSTARNFEVQKLAEGVYAVVRKDLPGLMVDANNVFIINDEDVIVVDANGAPAITREVLAALRKLTDKPVRYVVNTHYHDDHIRGNQVYREVFPGVEFIGHAFARTYLPAEGAANRKGFLEGAPRFRDNIRSLLEKNKSLGGWDLTEEERASYRSDIRLIDLVLSEGARAETVLPTITVEDRLTLHRGGRVIDILHLGNGHTAADLVVYLPKEGVLAAGDLVVAPVPLVGNPQSHVREWAATLEKIVALRPSVIVPGHGPLMRDDSYVRTLAEMFASIAKQTEAAFARGETLEQARKSVNLEEFRKRLVGESQVRRVAFSMYVAGPAVAAAFREASAAKAGGE